MQYYLPKFIDMFWNVVDQDDVKACLKANEVYLGEATWEFSKDAARSAQGEAKAISKVKTFTGNFQA